VNVRTVFLGITSGLLAGTLLFGVSQASVAAAASPAGAPGISIGSEWTFEVLSPIYPNGWGCQTQTFYGAGVWRSDEGPPGGWHLTKKGTTLREGFEFKWVFKATYEASTTYFSGGSGPAYVGVYSHHRARIPAELVPGVIAGC